MTFIWPICKADGCGKPLTLENRTGLCQSHNLRRLNADPAFAAKRNAAVRAAGERRAAANELAGL